MLGSFLERSTGEVTGASAGVHVYSGTSGQHRDNSIGVKRHMKRKRLDPNLERGIHNSCG